MAKKLDKAIDPKKETSFKEQIDVSGLELESDTSGVDEIDDNDSDYDFDEDGNFVSDSEEDETEVTATPEDDESLDEDDSEDEESEDEDEPDEEEVPVVKTGKKKSPETAAIIRLKKEKQAIVKKNRELEQQLQAKQETAAETSLVEKYMNEGLSEDAAKEKANTDVRFKRLEEKADLGNFLFANAKLFDRYPNAVQDATTIMRNCNVTKMTPTQIMRGMYGTSAPEHEQRAYLSATGNSTRNTSSAGNVSADRVASHDKTESLSPKDRAFKKMLEKTFNDGQPMSYEEFKKHRRE